MLEYFFIIDVLNKRCCLCFFFRSSSFQKSNSVQSEPVSRHRSGDPCGDIDMIKRGSWSA